MKKTDKVNKKLHYVIDLKKQDQNEIAVSECTSRKWVEKLNSLKMELFKV